MAATRPNRITMQDLTLQEEENAAAVTAEGGLMKELNEYGYRPATITTRASIESVQYAEAAVAGKLAPRRGVTPDLGITLATRSVVPCRDCDSIVRVRHLRFVSNRLPPAQL